MIVKCEKCQTRFKIPDEKVTDKGVRVRCTKCQHTFRVARSPSAAASEASDPFAAFGAPPSEGAPPSGVGVDPFDVPTRLQPALKPPASPDLAFGSTSWDEDQPTRIGGVDLQAVFAAAQDADGEGPQGPPEPAAPPEPPSLHWDAPAPPPPSPPPPRRAAGAFAAAVPAPAPAHAGPDANFDPFGSLNLEDEPEPPQAPPAFAAAAPAPASDFEEGGGWDGPLAAPEPPGLLDDLPPAEPKTVSGPGPDRSLFDLPPPPPPLPQPAAPEYPTPSQPLARIALSTIAVTPSETPVTLPPELPMPPAGHGTAPHVPQVSSARRAAGLLGHGVSAAVLVCLLVLAGTLYVNDGIRLKDLTAGRVLETWFGTEGLRAVDVSNGLYETRSGRPVFYVRGQVVNGGERPARIRVRAEVLDGDAIVQSAETAAGLVPTPEELYLLSSAEEAAALGAKLEKGGVEVPPGGRAPFVVTFHDYPPDLAAYKLRVQLSDGAAREAVAR